MKPVNFLSIICFFLLVTSTQIFAQAEVSSRKPNILFIITDQQSADAMSCIAGERYFNTPSMDRIAERGTIFNKAYCAHPVCIPSRSAIFSGRYPQETGILSFREKGNNYTGFQSLGKIFRDQGYETGYVGKWHIPIDHTEKSVHGFEFFENIMHNGADLNNSKKAIDFLTKERDKPFLLVASYNNPHNICEWARGNRGESLPDGDIGYPPPLDLCPPLKDNHMPPEDETEIMTLLRRSYQNSSTFPVGDFGEKEWREYRWAYFRMIELVDKHIGKVLSALHESGQDKETIILFTSDHGDCQGAHQWNQKTVFYDESSRVPFIISYPGNNPGSVSEQLVHTGVDIIPTLCNLAGIPVPDNLPGINLAPIALGKIKEIQREYIVTQTRFLQGGEFDGRIPKPSGRMLRSKRYKYCVYNMGNHRESLIDMERDPGEMVNLARKDSHANILKEHRNYLWEWCNKYGDDFPVPGFH